jgi:SAM-dependent methyltransferase
MGRWSRQLAPRYVSWLKIPANAHWLDVGCGTGALTHAICSHGSPASVLGCDPAVPFIEYAQKHCADERAAFVVAGAGSLPRRAGGYGCVASLFALNFFPDAGAAVHEMRSLTAPAGTVSACVWDYAAGMAFLRHFWDAAVALDTRARALDEGTRFPLCQPEALTEVFRAGGLSDVRCEPIEMVTVFANFEDYWRPFLGGTGPAPSYVASLDARTRAALMARLEQALTDGVDGMIAMTARAWAVRGTANG